jgi:hypothetical protein
MNTAPSDFRRRYAWTRCRGKHSSSQGCFSSTRITDSSSSLSGTYSAVCQRRWHAQMFVHFCLCTMRQELDIAYCDYSIDLTCVFGSFNTDIYFRSPSIIT